MKHWATQVIGKPWAADGDGPERFSCWGLVRWTFRVRDGLDMPSLQVGIDEPANAQAITALSKSQGWRPVQGEPRDADIVLMRDMVDGRRHVGRMVATTRGLLLLHADGHQTRHGPIGFVVADELRDATFGRYASLELWRRLA